MLGSPHGGGLAGEIGTVSRKAKETNPCTSEFDGFWP